MHLAWFSPLPPVRSGVADYSADLLSGLARSHRIDAFVDRQSGTPLGDAAASPIGVPVSDAHDFLWRARRDPYDLVVYQLGNAPCHDYMWAYLVHSPGLVVLHDARLHHARARLLLMKQGRTADYRAEFMYSHPDARPEVTEYAVEGLSGGLYYLWPMLRVVVSTARLVAAHSRWVAAELGHDYPGTEVDLIRMGVPAATSGPGARARVRARLGLAAGAAVFTAFGKVTAQKRVAAMLRALGAAVTKGHDAHLLLVGDVDEYPSLTDEIGAARMGGRVHVTGWVDQEAAGEYLAAADACLCLRWPTARETSASWLRCLAAARATVISDLAHLGDIPAIDARSWRTAGPREPVAVAVDLLDEDRALQQAVIRLASDVALRDNLARAGHAYWAAGHTVEKMTEDYERVLARASSRPAPQVTGLPAHFTEDYSGRARDIASSLGVDLDIL